MKLYNLFIFLIIFLITLSNDNINLINGQYASDPCVVSQNMTGVITATNVIPQTCWKIVPSVGAAYIADYINVQVLSSSLGDNSVLKIISGSDILSDSPVLTINGSVANTEQIKIYNGIVILFLDSSSSDENANVTDSSFTVSFASTKDKKLKPSVVGLISVAVAFGVPLIIVSVIRCLIPNSTTKQRALTIKKVFFWLSFILGLVFLAMILSRKVGV